MRFIFLQNFHKETLQSIDYYKETLQSIDYYKLQTTLYSYRKIHDKTLANLLRVVIKGAPTLTHT